MYLDYKVVFVFNILLKNLVSCEYLLEELICCFEMMYVVLMDIEGIGLGLEDLIVVE